MRINLNKAHILTKSDNTKLYETSEVIRLTAMYNNKLANALKARLASPACSETEYRKAISDSIVVVKPHKQVSLQPDITGRNCIVNAMTQHAYVLPNDIEFNTGSTYTTFTHDKLDQLGDLADLIKADLRATDILRYEQLSKVEAHHYKVIVL
ncbi:hypothetical protein [Vibrio parahaemolyticus]|uniref:hypothetical protein n=1 Tax=Vibrio parahaemolyticus TaxID=670 RepID=UPI0009EF9FC8|nr:hypothetical protein [Vibrio parahaemolyticus]OQU28098.1 hypothetical protein EM47_001245 [Vibrio parahaemolyticus]